MLQTKSGRPSPYDAGAAHEALPDAVHEAMVFHAVGRSVIVEKNNHKGTEMYMMHGGRHVRGKDIWQEGFSSRGTPNVEGEWRVKPAPAER